MFFWIPIALVSIPDLLLLFAQGLPILSLFANVKIVENKAFLKQLSRCLYIFTLVLIQLFGLCNWCRFFKHTKFRPVVSLIAGLLPLVEGLERLLAQRGVLSGD